MERLTTNRDSYFKEVIKELTEIDLSNNEESKFVFCEIGQLLTHGFSVSLILGEKEYLRMKIWNSHYDNERFKLRIFNLDRLAVTERDLDLSEFELNEVNGILEQELDTKKYAGIVLDGLFCQLKIGNKTLEWNIDEEMNKNLNSLITILRKKASVQQSV
ncbi:hypothetical protein [uncultured Lacinutrix sp.]|uniref:hypothetical protein n=1 Tax=uncultured Lacinutrix sp. TaxID=574032 RepID=UPI00263A1939|nr:hypothetical protein [uncultured Lacinutrix sp.]